MMSSTYIGCIAALVSVCLYAPALAASPGDVIITEIMYNPYSDETVPVITEWIEIYNTTSNSIDLTGWYIADEDGRSGAFEPYTLPAGGIAVVIPKGNATSPLTKADFVAAWRIDVSRIVQVTDTGDQSGPRPSNAAQGAISGSGLLNSPLNNGDLSDDLQNTPWGSPPCPYGVNPCVTTPTTPPRDSEVQLLVDNTDVIIDKVGYDDSSPWPSSANGPSIALKAGFINAGDNDLGTSWERSVSGTHRATNPNATNIFSDLDVGSPGEIDGITTGNQMPSAIGQTKPVVKGGTVDIDLSATDDGAPAPATLNYIVNSLPTNGTVLAVDANHVITAGDLPYIIPGGLKLLRYINNGAGGNDSFTFKASDTELTSSAATVTLLVEEGGVIITEIMYNPASDETSPSITEWVELYNTTGSPVNVTGWYLKGADTNRGGDLPTAVIPAGGVAVVIPPGNGSTRLISPALFETAWGTMPLLIQESINNQSPTGGGGGGMVGGNLVNSPGADGSNLQLIDGAGKVQDVASYTNSGAWPAVATSDGTSIYLKPGKYNAGDNNDGANWWKGYVCSDGAMVILPTASNPPYNLENEIVLAADKGSPGYLAGVSTSNRPPAPRNMDAAMIKDSGSKTFSLDVCDDGVGTPTFVFTILSLPANGTLKDPNAGNADITAVPYILAGSSVTYTPDTGFNSTITPGAGAANGSENNDTFTYTVDELGGLASNTIATVNMIVQLGGVVITEILYDPSRGTANKDWEYVEITNTTDYGVFLAGLLNANLKNADSRNLSFTAGIPAHSTRIIVAPDTLNRTVDEFVTEWGCAGLTRANLLEIVGTKPAFSNGGDTLFITDVNNNVIDRVRYSNGTDGWPASTNSASVYLSPNKVNVADNDDAANWQLSVDGVAGACATPENAGDTTSDSDVGSPGIISAGCTAPSITGQPTNQSVAAGATVNFSVTAASPALAYQWCKGVTPLTNGGKISGTTTATLTLTGVDAADAGFYKVLVSNGCAPDAVSNVVSLSVCTPPSITAQPANQVVSEGGNATFSVTATGGGLTYQWRRGGVNLTDGAKYNGVNTTTLTIANVQNPEDEDSYDCLVGNGCGAPVASNMAILTVMPPPLIITAWRSLKTHSGYGEVAITLNAAATATGSTAGGIKVESRNISAQNGLTKVQVDFSGPVTLNNPAAVTITGLSTSGCTSAGANCVSAPKTVTAPTVTILPNGTTMQLAFTNGSAAGDTCYTITIGSDAVSPPIVGDNNCKVRMLQSDSTGDGLVALADLSQIKSRFNQAITTTNGPSDQNLAAGIGLADISQTKSRFGRRALCP